jgi:hypothetical protein
VYRVAPTPLHVFAAVSVRYLSLLPPVSLAGSPPPVCALTLRHSARPSVHCAASRPPTDHHRSLLSVRDLSAPLKRLATNAIRIHTSFFSSCTEMLEYISRSNRQSLSSISSTSSKRASSSVSCGVGFFGSSFFAAFASVAPFPSLSVFADCSFASFSRFSLAFGRHQRGQKKERYILLRTRGALECQR